MDNQLLLKRKSFVEDPDALSKKIYVLDSLLDAGVLCPNEVEDIEANLSIEGAVRELVDTVRRKGSAASSVLLDAWEEASAYLRSFDSEDDDDEREEEEEDEHAYLRGTSMDPLTFPNRPSTSGAACNTVRKQRCARRIPTRLNLRDPGEFMYPQVFSKLDLSAHQTPITNLVVDVLKEMGSKDLRSKDVREFVWHYCKLIPASFTLADPVELASMMLEYAHYDVRIYAERVYSMLKVCYHTQLARNFRRDVFRVCAE